MFEPEGKYIIYNGREYEYELFLNLADYEIFEELYWEENQFTIQEIFDVYCEEHLKKYGEEFVINYFDFTLDFLPQSRYTLSITNN